MSQEDYALVIGVDDYPNYSSLRGAKADAQRFADWVCADGGVSQDNCKLILSGSSPATPTYDIVDSALDEIHHQGEQTGKRRLFFYFSGHGQTTTSRDTNMCLAEWSESRARLALSYLDWKTTIIDCTGFTEIYFFLDCCRVPVYGGGGIPPSLTCADAVRASSHARCFTGFAAEFRNRAFEASHEVVPGELTYGGNFTEALIAALTGGAAEDDGGVRPSQLKEYLEWWTPKIADDNKQPAQEAVVSNEIPSHGPILGTARPFGTLDTEMLKAITGEVAIINPKNDLLYQGKMELAPDAITDARYGTYLIETVDGDRKGTFEFQPNRLAPVVKWMED